MRSCRGQVGSRDWGPEMEVGMTGRNLQAVVWQGLGVSVGQETFEESILHGGNRSERLPAI